MYNHFREITHIYLYLRKDRQELFSQSVWLKHDLSDSNMIIAHDYHYNDKKPQ